MQVNPYLNFNGNCEDALNFYKTALGADVTGLMRFKDAPDPSMIKPGMENKVMHACFRIGDSQVMASDARCDSEMRFQSFSLALMPADKTEAERLFAALQPGGQVQMPMSETFFSQAFGMVQDRFGVSWMVVAPPKESAAAA